MAELINLRLARKARARAEAERQAAANRARHGERKGDREQRSADLAREERRLDNLRRETDPPA